MNRKGFILPLVLLILALMSGIAVVLGRLSSEKTLSLKKQESSYYAKEITVILVAEETTDDSGETDDGGGDTVEDSTPVVITKNDVTLKNGNGALTVISSATEEYKNIKVVVSDEGENISSVSANSKQMTSEGALNYIYTFTDTQNYLNLVIRGGGKNNVVTVTVTLTP
ncbi:hypothetical protein [uncultured Ilyobacter sp.]|uniref:hypothetical protein n=1 Tax=uncultured Ilyobacter sp. TaxID=544433 RepID=UPI0029F4E450|nr:hypothetical protein [uncultured Ilyobacter sp.]